MHLEGPEVIEGTGVTHLRYRVAKDGGNPAAEKQAGELAQAGRR